MLQLNYIRENKDEIIKRLAVKNFDASVIVNEVIELDDLRKKTTKRVR